MTKRKLTTKDWATHIAAFLVYGLCWIIGFRISIKDGENVLLESDWNPARLIVFYHLIIVAAFWVYLTLL